MADPFLQPGIRYTFWNSTRYRKSGHFRWLLLSNTDIMGKKATGQPSHMVAPSLSLAIPCRLRFLAVYFLHVSDEIENLV